MFSLFAEVNFFFLKTELERWRERQRLTICQSNPKVAAVAKIGQFQSEELGVSSRSPHGGKNLNPQLYNACQCSNHLFISIVMSLNLCACVIFLLSVSNFLF